MDPFCNSMFIFVIVFTCFCCNLVNVSGSVLECDKEKIKEAISSEMKYFPSTLTKHFQNFSEDFEAIFDQELDLSDIKINSRHFPSNAPPSVPQNFESLLKKFPQFSNTFLNSSGLISHVKNWELLQREFETINKIAENSQNKLNLISKNQNSRALNVISTFNKTITEIKLKFSGLNKSLKSLNLTINAVKGRANCQRNENATTLYEGGETEVTYSPSNQKETEPAHDDIPRDCYESYVRGNKESGPTIIQAHPTLEPQTVWCNHSWDGGGWTVVLRRCPQKIQLNFRRPLSEYESGFGSPDKEYWIGLSTMHRITTRKPNELLVFVTIPGETAFARYHNFRVGEGDGYRLHVSGYDISSTAGNSLSYHDRMLFSTFNYDRDMDPVRSCSTYAGGGGFWFNFCYHTNPTGVYPPKGLPKDTALHSMVEWRRWKGFHTFLSHLVMMVRPTNKTNKRVKNILKN